MVVFVEDARRQFGVLRMLTDARDAPVQAADAVSKYKVPTYAMQSPDDLLAVVVGSSLEKMQTDPMFNDPRARAFLSIETARICLMSDTA